MKNVQIALEKIVGGGQTIGTLPDGKKVFVWGGLPGEVVEVEITSDKSRYASGVVSKVITWSNERVEPLDPDTYLATSPWQILDFGAEQHYKALLIDDAFNFHGISLPNPSVVQSDQREYHYRNKMEFNWIDTAISSGSTLDLAFFERGTHTKIRVEQSALIPDKMMQLALAIRDQLRTTGIKATQLKSLIIRADQSENCIWQLYIATTKNILSTRTISQFEALGGEVIYSNPKSRKNVATKRLNSVGELTLSDTILGIPFHYTADSFFQINPPMYEKALREMQNWLDTDTPVVDLYSGVGTIGLTIGGDTATLVEINENAVHEMKRNITALGSNAIAIQAASERALDYIVPEKTIIVDPPRAGLDKRVIARLLDTKPSRIIYLSCNPVTQARDVKYLAGSYKIVANHGYNFFPHTPHIEHLIVLERTNQP